MARKISFINYKGGVGKTSLIVNTAACLVKAGKRVLLFDLDTQSNASIWLLRLERWNQLACGVGPDPEPSVRQEFQALSEALRGAIERVEAARTVGGVGHADPVAREVPLEELGESAVTQGAARGLVVDQSPDPRLDGGGRVGLAVGAVQGAGKKVSQLENTPGAEEIFLGRGPGHRRPATTRACPTPTQR